MPYHPCFLLVYALNKTNASHSSRSPKMTCSLHAGSAMLPTESIATSPSWKVAVGERRMIVCRSNASSADHDLAAQRPNITPCLQVAMHDIAQHWLHVCANDKRKAHRLFCLTSDCAGIFCESNPHDTHLLHGQIHGCGLSSSSMLSALSSGFSTEDFFRMCLHAHPFTLCPHPQR